MRRILLAAGLAAAATALAGCAAQPPAVRAQAEAPAAPPMAPMPARGEASFVVRTAALAPAGVNLEVAGVDCEARSDGYVARFRTPARVVVPDFGPASPAVAVNCRAGGQAGSALVPPRPAGAYQGLHVTPSIGIGIGTGGRAGVGLGAGLHPVRGADRVRYGDVRVLLR